VVFLLHTLFASLGCARLCGCARGMVAYMSEPRFNTTEEAEAWLILAAGAMAGAWSGDTTLDDGTAFAARAADAVLAMWRERRRDLPL
jgi:hypothetical protein